MTRQFKIMTFNLRVLVPTDPFPWDQRKNWIADTIKEYQPDVIGIQELTPAMLDWLSTAFHHDYEIYAVNRVNSDTEGEFIAILASKTSFTIGNKGAFMLSETPEEIGSIGWDAHYPRICNWADLLHRETEEPIIKFFNTHLDHMGQAARKNGLSLIHRNMEDTSLPILLTGDFNATPDNEALAAVKQMQSCYTLFSEDEKKNSLTFHNYKGGKKGSPIDYIYADNGARIKATTIIRDNYNDGYPSDHYPVLSTVEIST